MCLHIPLKERTQIRKVMLQKWRHQKRKHSVHAYFRKNQKRSILRTEKYGDLTTAEHKILSEGRESRNNHRYAVVVQVLATQRNPCQTKTSQETEKNLRKVPQPLQKPKVNSYVQLIFYLASIVKNYHGIIEQLHFIDQRQAEMQNELNLDRMISGGRILWNAVAICEMTKTSWQNGNLKMNEDLKNPSRTCFVRGENLGRRYSDCWDWRIGKVRCIRNISQKTECDRRPDNPKRWRNIFPKADDPAKLSGRDYEFQEPTLRWESTVRRENLSGESHGDREEFRPEE